LLAIPERRQHDVLDTMPEVGGMGQGELHRAQDADGRLSRTIRTLEGDQQAPVS
jgi:hypothetical protein